MKNYYSTVDSVVLTHSDIQNESSGRRVYVYFERPNDNGFDFAEGILPENVFTKTYGFTDEELLDLSAYLKDNALLIWDYSQKGGGLSA